MIKITRWKPDTCDCVLEYEWDTEEAEEVRTHTPIKVQSCAAHQFMDQAPENVYGKVKEENSRKNIALGKVLEHAPEAAKRAGGHAFNAEDEPTWEFDENRKLHIHLSGKFTQGIKTAIKAELNKNTVEIV